MVKLVDIRGLWRWACKHLGPRSKLRDVIILDEDYLLPYGHLANLGIWLKLYDIEDWEKCD